jgi:hypothetical protein
MRNNENVFEVTHVIDISKETYYSVVPLSSTFNTIKAKNLEDAKKMLDDATPKGMATIISEKSNKYAKHIYVENVGEYTITHIISIKKNGILLKENMSNNTKLSGNQSTTKQNNTKNNNIPDDKSKASKKATVKRNSSDKSKSNTKSTHSKKRYSKAKPKH